MHYQEYDPHPELRTYIAAYWTATGTRQDGHSSRILPDGCIDIILNLGEDYAADNLVMKNEQAYLVGTMTRYKETAGQGQLYLLGIRFRPAAFVHFYRFASLHEVTDRTIEFDPQFPPDLYAGTTDVLSCLDHFFLRRLGPVRHALQPVIADIYTHGGQISVAELSQRHYTTVRQLERIFKAQTGLGPRQFINFVRYQAASQCIRTHYPRKTLFDIALDCGYYDHAHLTNEVKKYSGLLPSEF